MRIQSCVAVVEFPPPIHRFGRTTTTLVVVDDARLTADALAGAAGDRDALARFVRATQGEVHRLCSFLVPAEDAADVAQDTFVRAIRALPRYRGEAPARLWLLSIARRSCADHFRTRYRRQGIEVRLPPTPDRVAPADPTLWALLDHLHPDQRAAFVLTQVLGLSYAEAAVAADCPVGTVRSRVARARAGLVSLLAAAEEAGGVADGVGRPIVRSGGGQSDD